MKIRVFWLTLWVLVALFQFLETDKVLAGSGIRRCLGCEEDQVPVLAEEEYMVLPNEEEYGIDYHRENSLGITSEMTVLEIGKGQGISVETLSRRLGTPTYVRTGFIKADEMNLSDIDLGERVDVAFVQLKFETLTLQEGNSLFLNIRRLLKKGGRVLIRLERPVGDLTGQISTLLMKTGYEQVQLHGSQFQRNLFVYGGSSEEVLLSGVNPFVTGQR